MKLKLFVVVILSSLFSACADSTVHYHCLRAVGIKEYTSSKGTKYRVELKDSPASEQVAVLYTDDVYTLGQTIGNCK